LTSCIGCPYYIADGYHCDTKFGRELRLFLGVRDTIAAAIPQAVATESPLPINHSDIGGDDND